MADWSCRNWSKSTLGCSPLGGGLHVLCPLPNVLINLAQHCHVFMAHQFRESDHINTTLQSSRRKRVTKEIGTKIFWQGILQSTPHSAKPQSDGVASPR